MRKETKMKRRIIAIAAALPMLLALFVFAPTANAVPPPPPPESQVNVTSYSRVGSGSLSAGSPTAYTVNISFPALAAGEATYPNLSVAQLQNMEITLGSSFGFANGQTVQRPFLASPPAAGATTASFLIDVLYTGSGNFLELTYTHDTGHASPNNKAVGEWKPFLSETLPQTEPPPIEIPPPTTYGSPHLSVSGNLPELEAGKNGTINFSLVNNSAYAAFGVSISLAQGSVSLFRPTGISASSINVGNITIGNANARSVSIPVEVFEDVDEGYYTVTVTATMRNGGGTTVTQDIPIQVFIKNPRTGTVSGKPSLNMFSATVDKNTPGADGIIELTLSIANVGDGLATDARVSLTGFRSTELMLNESLVTKALGDIEPGEKTPVTYSLRVAEELGSGSYPLNVEVRYKLPDGTDATMTDMAYINIIRPTVSTETRMQLTGISQDVSNPGSANTVRLTLTITNSGATTARDVSVGFSGLSASAFTLAGDFGDRKLENIEAGATVSTTFSLYVSPSLVNGNYPLTVVIKYSDSEGAQERTVETDVYVRVNRPDPPKEEPEEEEPPGGVPRVIISRHSISVESVVAGSPFELSVTLLNTSETKNIENMKVTFTDAAGVFIPVAGVNSFYIPELPIGQTTEISITLSAKQDAETKSYPITISLEYEDEKSRPYTVSESLSIPVYLPQRLEVSNVNFFEDGRGMAFLSFQFINKGKSPLYNMNIRIEGSMSAMEGDYYIGTFHPGQADYFEDTIIPFMFGDVEGAIVLEYEDSAGTMQELRYPLMTYIGEPYYPDPGEEGFFPGGPGGFPFDPGFPGGEDGMWIDGMWVENGGGGEGLPLWLLLTIIGGVVLAGLIVTIVLVKKAKRKRIEMEDDAYVDSMNARPPGGASMGGASMGGASMSGASMGGAYTGEPWAMPQDGSATPDAGTGAGLQDGATQTDAEAQTGAQNEADAFLESIVRGINGNSDTGSIGMILQDSAFQNEMAANPQGSASLEDAINKPQDNINLYDMGTEP